MLAVVALASFLVMDTPAAPVDPAALRDAPRPAAGGRSAEDQVRLAYWCEAHGLTAERVRHLTQAVLADPANVAARGLLGLVARDGRWVRPEVVAARQQADPAAAALLDEYDARRAATPYKADAQFDLGAWADEHGLKDQARAHFTAAVRLDPGRDAAWRRLGYVKRDGRWATDAQLAAERADADAQHQADRKWRPLLERWRDQLAKAAHRAEAEANLLAVTDPRAVPSILKVFADQPRAAQLLGQVDSPAASRWLARLALDAGTEGARGLARETLRHRDPREFADILIGRIRKPIRYQVKPVEGPGRPGQLLVEGKQFNVDRVYAPPSFSFELRPTDQISYDANGLPVVSRFGLPYYAQTGRIVASDLPTLATPIDPTWKAQLDANFDRMQASLPQAASRNQVAWYRGQLEAGSQDKILSRLHEAVERVERTEKKNPTQFGFSLTYAVTPQANIAVGRMMVETERAAEVARQQLAGDVKQLDDANRRIQRANDQAIQILLPMVGRDLGQDPEPWKKWWVEQLGYRYALTSEADRPTFVEEVPLAYQPTLQVSDASASSLVGFQRMSCFGAGTPVQTAGGPRAIETLQVGDVVLTQSTGTGALGYRPILAVHHNPPSGTFRIKLGDDAIVASAFHRFWLAGRGWVMARDLKAGDPLRVLGGVAAIESVEPGGVQPVFNLDVADDADFFAGRAAALVHDNTLPDPRLIPFDRPAEDKKLADR